MPFDTSILSALLRDAIFCRNYADIAGLPIYGIGLRNLYGIDNDRAINFAFVIIDNASDNKFCLFIQATAWVKRVMIYDLFSYHPFLYEIHGMQKRHHIFQVLPKALFHDHIQDTN